MGNHRNKIRGLWYQPHAPLTDCFCNIICFYSEVNNVKITCFCEF